MQREKVKKEKKDKNNKNEKKEKKGKKEKKVKKKDGEMHGNGHNSLRERLRRPYDRVRKAPAKLDW